MLNLTSQQQRVLCGIVFLLLFGWTVKVWRQMHPSKQAQAGTVAKP